MLKRKGAVLVSPLERNSGHSEDLYSKSMITSILYLAKNDLQAKLPGFSFRQHTVLITSFPAPQSI